VIMTPPPTNREQATTYLMYAKSPHQHDVARRQHDALLAIAHLLISIDDRLARQSQRAVVVQDERDWPGDI